MAKRILKAQIRPISCRLSESDNLVTKPNLAMTPSQVKELTDKGIAVSLPNEKQFLDGTTYSGSTDWSVDPVFKRSVDMCQLWELEKSTQGKLIRAHRLDKQKFGN